MRYNSLLRVKLDDELLLQRNVDLSALGQLVHEDAQGIRNNLQPCRYVGINKGVLSVFEPFIFWERGRTSMMSYCVTR